MSAPTSSPPTVPGCESVPSQSKTPSSSPPSFSRLRLLNLPWETRLAIYNLILSDLHLTPCPFSTIQGRTLQRPGLITVFGKQDPYVLLAYKAALMKLCHESATILHENRVTIALLHQAEYHRQMNLVAQGLMPEDEPRSSVGDAQRVMASTRALHMQTVREVRREVQRLRAEGFIEQSSSSS
ncbi:hypothetical protein PRZ48_012582 [Zasmidium cellare]|uniref:Uncharacterized protein n=1 Tax=Zasmidium cellare TaxID=395010 RepID=A0ABR0E5A3_ZASCE|nr:hypothetical protein PRZ48_012582 [Zasmidium cellare]